MVWGMALPGNFGHFWPSGEYIGWDEALTDYFNNAMPADEKALFSHVSEYIYYASQKLKNPPGKKIRQSLPPFGPIAAHEAPKRFAAAKRHSSLGSLIMLNSRILAVDGHLKLLIERLEPDTHHFFPIEIVMPGGVIHPEQYYVMAIGQYLDSFARDQSNPASWGTRSPLACLRHVGKYVFYEESKSLMSGLALSRQLFGFAHLWRERCMMNELICFSDELISAAALSGLRLPKHCRLKEV